MRVRRPAVAIVLSTAILSSWAIAQTTKPAVHPPAMRGPIPEPAPINGRVIEDGTGRLISNYVIAEGLALDHRNQPLFHLDNIEHFTGSAFTFNRRYRSIGKYATILRVSAPGYETGDSDPIPSDSADPVEIHLKPAAATIQVRLMDADGRPAAAAKVYVVGPGQFISLSRGKAANAGRTGFASAAVASSDGDVRFTPPTGKYRAIALSDAGYAKFEASAGDTVTLTKWAALKVIVKNGPRPGDRMPPLLRAVPSSDAEPRDGMFSNSTSEPLGRDGTVQLTHLFIGDMRVELSIIDRQYRPQRGITLGTVDLKPGASEKLEASLGDARVRGVMRLAPGLTEMRRIPGLTFGTLRAVRPEPAFPMPKDLATWDLDRLAAFNATWKETPEGKAFMAAAEGADAGGAADSSFSPAEDGTFVIDNVAPGKYWLQIAASGMSPKAAPTANGRLDVDMEGIARSTVDVPAHGEVDIGELVLGKANAMEPGTAALEVDCPTLDGTGRVRLSTYRGKVVVLHFWATTCGPCVRMLPELKKMREEFGPTGKFEVVGMALDVPTVAYEYVRRHGYDWPQAYAGFGSRTTTQQDYRIVGVGSLWVIGADGKVVASDLSEQELRTVVAKAVADAGGAR